MQRAFIAFSLISATTVGVLGAQPAHALSLRSDLWETFNKMVNQERKSLQDSALPLLNPEDLFWNGADPVDVFFINEGAGYRNQLLFSANGGPSQMIFEDVSSKKSILPNSDGPLTLGEGKTLGAFTGETQLDFMIKANGFKNKNGKIYGSNAANNPDKLEHLIAFSYFDEVEKQSYVILGFEDLYGDESQGSDRDFNDVVFAVRGIQEGAPSTEPTEVPEPSLAIALVLGVCGAGTLYRRRSEAV